MMDSLFWCLWYLFVDNHCVDDSDMPSSFSQNGVLPIHKSSVTLRQDNKTSLAEALSACDLELLQLPFNFWQVCQFQKILSGVQSTML